MRTNSGRRVAVSIAVGIIFVAGIALIRQGREISQLQEKNRALREEIQAREQAARRHTSAAHARPDDELRRLRVEAQEVHKLRNEVSQLRAQRSELETLRDENLRLKSAPRAGDSPVDQSARQPDYYAKENWIFAG